MAQAGIHPSEYRGIFHNTAAEHHHRRIDQVDAGGQTDAYIGDPGFHHLSDTGITGLIPPADGLAVQRLDSRALR